MQVSKRIIHIVEAPGGVERYLITLLSNMKKYTGFEHYLICSNLYQIDKFRGLVKAVAVIKDMGHEISLTHDIKAVVEVRRAIKRFKPDIVYCHSSKAGVIGRISDFGIKNKVLYNAHGWSFNIRGISAIKRVFFEMIERMLSPMTDIIVCISEYEKQSALNHRICKKEKLIVINSGIDLNGYTYNSTIDKMNFGIPKNAFVIGTVGRLSPQKAPDIFVKMAYMVKKRIPEAFFVIVGDDIGDGTFGKKIQQMIKKYRLENCFFVTGWVDNPLEYVEMFDVATLLSRWEGFGLVLPEYMMMKKPIVGSSADAIPYVIGNAGIIVDKDDYMQAAEAVIELYKDRDKTRRIIDVGVERVKMFDAKRMAEESKSLFCSMIE